MLLNMASLSCRIGEGKVEEGAAKHAVKGDARVCTLSLQSLLQNPAHMNHDGIMMT